MNKTINITCMHEIKYINMIDNDLYDWVLAWTRQEYK